MVGAVKHGLHCCTVTCITQVWPAASREHALGVTAFKQS
jgi:hypothetical protein